MLPSSLSLFSGINMSIGQCNSLLANVWNVHLEVVDCSGDSYCINGSFLHYVVQNIHLWIDLGKELEQIQKCGILEFHGQAICLADGDLIPSKLSADVFHALGQYLTVLQHSIDGSAFEVPSCTRWLGDPSVR